MEKSTNLGTTALVDEIISDALQKLQTGDLLPASETSSMSVMHEDPVARSTSIANIPGLRGYRSFTDDVIKSFMDRDSIDTSTDERESEEKERSFKETLNPFDGMTQNQQLESSDEFISGEKLLNEFNNDEKRCRDENLFRENRPVPIECASIAESPEKLLKKQVKPPEWATNSPQLDSFSYFAGQTKTSNLTEGSTMTASFDRTFASALNVVETLSVKESSLSYDPGLPYRLGVVLPGVSSTFDLPRPVSLNSKMMAASKSYLNGKLMHMCKLTYSADKLSLVLTPPQEARGEILVSIETSPNKPIMLSALCMSPVFNLPEQITVPLVDVCVIPLKVVTAFPIPVDFSLESPVVRLERFRLTPSTETVSLELRNFQKTRSLELTLLYQEQKFMTLTAHLEVRHFKISIDSVQDAAQPSILVNNLEMFPVEVNLTDDSGFLRYPSRMRLKRGQSLIDTAKSFNVPFGQPERLVTFSLELLSPVRALLPTKCSYRFGPALADLRPDLARFMWLTEDQTEFAMVDHATGAPTPWKDRVLISPCPAIEKYVKITADPKNPAKVVLKISRPLHLIFGRLRFYRRSAEGEISPTPYGFRYPIIVPQEPYLRWQTAVLNSTAKIYQIPIDGRLRITNPILHDVFILTPDDGLVIPPGETCELLVRQPCRIFYGLEAWRQTVKSKATNYLDRIKELTCTEGMNAALVLRDFPLKQRGVLLVDNKLLDSIPSDLQSVVRLYELFQETTVCVRLQHPKENGTFFF